MRTVRAGLALLLVLVASASMLARQPDARAESSTLYIALGDSIAYGIGSSLPRKRSYPTLVSGYIEDWSGAPVELRNLAMPGETSTTFTSEGQLDELRRVLESQASDGVQTIVTVSLGGNEMLQAEALDNAGKQAALDEFAVAYDTALGEIRALAGEGSLIVVTTNYDLSEGNPEQQFSDAWWVARFNSVIATTATAHGASVADIEPVFRGRINELTLHPWDVHPKNRGFLAIARQVWSAIGLDQEPPEVEAVSGMDSGRTLRTIQLLVIDGGQLAAVSIEIDGKALVTPASIGEDTWAVLVDLRDEERSTLPVIVRATDIAGNERTAEFELVATTN